MQKLCGQVNTFIRGELYRQALRQVNAECTQFPGCGTFPATLNGECVFRAFGPTPKSGFVLKGYTEKSVALKTILYRRLVLAAAAAMLGVAGLGLWFAPQAPAEIMQRGWARARAGHYAEAARDFSQVLRFKPNGADARLLRGCCLASSGDFVAAIGDFNQCLLANGGNAAAWFDRGMAYQQMGDWKSAAHDFETVRDLRPGDERAIRALENANGRFRQLSGGQLAAPIAD